jgi:hypothetical protein
VTPEDPGDVLHAGLEGAFQPGLMQSQARSVSS